MVALKLIFPLILCVPFVFSTSSRTDENVLSGIVDTFSTLDRTELEELSVDSGDSLEERLTTLSEFQSVTFIDVKLVGFDGDGNEGIFVDERQILKHLRELKSDHMKASLLHPEEGQVCYIFMGFFISFHQKPHDMLIRHKFLFRVSKASRMLLVPVLWFLPYF